MPTLSAVCCDRVQAVQQRLKVLPPWLQAPAPSCGPLAERLTLQALLLAGQRQVGLLHVQSCCQRAVHQH